MAPYTREETGIRASLHRTEIGLLERGERTPRIDTLVKVAGAVGANPADLLAGIDWKPGEVQLGVFHLGSVTRSLSRKSEGPAEASPSPIT